MQRLREMKWLIKEVENASRSSFDSNQIESETAKNSHEAEEAGNDAPNPDNSTPPLGNGDEASDRGSPKASREPSHPSSLDPAAEEQHNPIGSSQSMRQVVPSPSPPPAPPADKKPENSPWLPNGHIKWTNRLAKELGIFLKVTEIDRLNYFTEICQEEPQDIEEWESELNGYGGFDFCKDQVVHFGMSREGRHLVRHNELEYSDWARRALLAWAKKMIPKASRMLMACKTGAKAIEELEKDEDQQVILEIFLRE